jgi:branched-chain amino acid transport system permease protein
MSTFGYWEPVLIFALLNVVATCGLYVTAMSGQISMATAALAGIAAYAAAVLTANFDWPLIPAALTATLGVAGLGAALGYLIADMRDFVLKLTTLAFGEAASTLAFNFHYIGGSNGFSGIPLYTDLPIVALAALVAIFVAWRYDRSSLGLASRAVREDPLAAASSGVSVRRVRVIGFATGAGLAAVAGSLSAHYVLVVVPGQLGFFYSLTFVIFLLAGGMYTLWGPVLAALVLTVLPELLRFASSYRLILFGLIIVLVVMLRPEGLISFRMRARASTGLASSYRRLLAAWARRDREG